MVPSVDFAVSSLLCAEDNASIFEDVESGDVVVDDYEISAWDHRNRRPFCQDSSFNGGEGFLSSGLLLPVQGEECLEANLKREIEHLPCSDYLKRLRSGEVDLGARNEAVDWIEKVQSYYNFGPLCAYLSINYLDRFLSAYELPKGKAWMMQLLAVASLSLAAKMEETEVPLSLDLQIGESRFVFEARTIKRMELLVLSTLKWRMQSVTPFSFIDYFLCKVCADQQIPPRCLFSQAFQLILSTSKEIDFLEFRPSEIAAAVAISVAGETYTTEDTEKAISLLSEHVEKGQLAKCVEKIQDFATMGAISRSVKINVGGGGSNPAVPQSPIGVLDASTCLSYRSDDTTNNTPVGSCANSTQNSPAFNPKRRRLNLENDW